MTYLFSGYLIICFLKTCESIEICACKTSHKSPAPLTIVVVTEFLFLASSRLHLIYLCTFYTIYIYIYTSLILKTPFLFLSHSYFHIFRRIGLKTDYHHFTSLDEHIDGKFHISMQFLTKYVACLPAHLVLESTMRNLSVFLLSCCL